MGSSNLRLVCFLRTLADEIDSGTIGDELIGMTRDFHLSYQFQKNYLGGDPRPVIDDIASTTIEENKNYSDYDEAEILKFLSMGWYIYIHIIGNKRYKNTHD